MIYFLFLVKIFNDNFAKKTFLRLFNFKNIFRSFDLRGKCRQNGAQFSAYHGIVDQKMDIKSIFPVFYKFLDENPSEFIVIFIKEEKKGVSDEVLTNMFDTMI